MTDKEIFVFAGPNGSGKSSIIHDFISNKVCPENYICPDDLVASQDKNNEEAYVQAMNTAEAMRMNAVKKGESFTFETVFSTEKKLDFLLYAKTLGYTLTTIYITTNDPLINIERVKKRVANGGHDVPTEKLLSRYQKCMILMPRVLNSSDSSMVLDNSVEDGSPKNIVTKTNGSFELNRSYCGSEWVQKYLIYPLTDINCKVQIIK